jgi:WD40 repeat protein
MRRFFSLLVFCVYLSMVLHAEQTRGNSGCSLSAPPFLSNKPNIFTEEQEQWLGSAQALQQEPAYDLLPDKDSIELDRIGQKLLAQLPPTQIHYRFQVYESEEANAFSIAGGYVYVSRKLITDARSEDEVAGVLAHEIGHIYTHQIAIAFTREFKSRMNVTSMGNRGDLEDKLQLLLNVARKDSTEESEDEQEKDELMADHVGLYAMTKAGYSPRAFAENLDRIAANKGRTGNILTDVLGATSEINLRVRVAHKIVATLPDECKQISKSSSPEFKEFQEAVRDVIIHPLIDASPGLESFKLDPPMRPALSQVRFSSDGKFILAQDESSIHVLARNPLKKLFSIDARGAEPAHFTPDSNHVVFHYRTMRVEKWEIATGKRESFHELVDYEGCPQTSLSPDGKTFVCLSFTNSGVWLKLTDVDSGQRFYDNKSFTLTRSSANFVTRVASASRLATVTYSQNGQYMLVVAGTKSLALDLVDRKPIDLGKDLAQLVDGRIAFVDSDKLVFDCDQDYKAGSSHDTFKMCETSFPAGLPVNTFKIGYQWLEPVSRGNHVLIGPFKENAAMLTDPSNGTASAGFKLNSLDIYDQSLATENDRGGLTVGDLGGQHFESIELPVSPMHGVESATFSPDGRFVAYSGNVRSSIWDLQTKKRVALMRPFRAARFNDQDIMFAQYKEAQQKPGQNSQIDLKTGKVAEGAKFAIDQFQRGDVMVTFQPLEKSGDTTKNITLQIADTATGTQLWSKRFSHDVPDVWQSDDGPLMFQIDLSDDTATEEIKHAGGRLLKASDWKNDWYSIGQLIEIVDSHTGEIKRMLQAPERHGNGGYQIWSTLYGDYLVVHGAYNNSVIYRISDGMRLGAFYGRAIAGDGKLGLIATTNRDQDVTIRDAKTGKQLKQVTVDHFPLAARFIAEKNALLVLTAAQSVYTIDLPAAGQAETAAK